MSRRVVQGSLLFAFLTFGVLHLGAMNQPEDQYPFGRGMQPIIMSSNNDYITSKTDFTEVFAHAIRDGFHRSVTSTVGQILSNVFKPLPDLVNRTAFFMATMVYRASYGSHGYNVEDLKKINNSVQAFVRPYASIAPGTLDKKRRAALIALEEAKDESKKLVDEHWLQVQREVIIELNHAIAYLKRGLPCYNLTYLDCPNSGLRYRLAIMVHTFSVVDCTNVSFYALRTIRYLEMLTNLISGFATFEAVYQKHEEVNRWLSYTTDSFERIALFLQSKDVNQRLMFQKNAVGGKSSLPPLESLLGPASNNSKLMP